MAKKKKHEEHENHERWVIPYADMVTLLFAFFVVMYAISTQDEEKMDRVSRSVSDAFMGVHGLGRSPKQIDLMGIEGEPQRAQKLLMQRTIANEEMIEAIQEALEVEGFDMIYEDEASPIQFRIDERGLVISMSAGYVFERGTSEVAPELYPVIGVVAEAINTTDRLIDVEGHTDDRPIVGSQFYDNWHLSVLRAVSMVRVLRDEFNVDPTRLRAAGYGPHRPIADNDTEKGRRRNRRVDIVMLNASDPEDLIEDPSIPR